MYSSIQELKRSRIIKGYTEYKIDENSSQNSYSIKSKRKETGVKPGDKDWFKLCFPIHDWSCNLGAGNNVIGNYLKQKKIS